MPVVLDLEAFKLFQRQISRQFRIQSSQSTFAAIGLLYFFGHTSAFCNLLSVAVMFFQL